MEKQSPTPLSWGWKERFNLEKSGRNHGKEMIAESVMASYIIDKGATYEDLKAIAERGGIDEIWSTDDKGNTTVTSVAPTVDFNFGADPNGQAAEYMQLLDGRAKEIVQKHRFAMSMINFQICRGR